MNEGDHIVVIGSDYRRVYYGNTGSYVTMRCNYNNFVSDRVLTFYNYDDEPAYSFVSSELDRIITGPCTVIPHPGNNSTRIVSYKIVRAYEENESSKYNASLNADGSRLAIALKQAGSNAVTRVYEFDGSLWNQLGDTIE